MNDNPTQQEFILRRLADNLQFAGREYAGMNWLFVLIPVLVLGLLFVVLMYRRDCRSISWPWALALGAARCTVYLMIAGVFLLPAWQTWETAYKRSRVIVLVDVSPSMSERSDDLPPEDGTQVKLATRLDKVAAYLADGEVGFLRKLAAKNPVYVYRFGARLDEEPAVFTAESSHWDSERWSRWLGMDFKRWLLDQVDEVTASALMRQPGFEPEQPGTAEWAAGWLKQSTAEATPPGLGDERTEKLQAARQRLDKRIESVRQLRLGTDVPAAVLQVMNREGGNLVQGLVLLSDGRSTLGAESSLSEVRARAGKDRVPVFAVLVGEDRPPVEIRITDVQTPEQTPPNEKFLVRVEVDGVGLSDQSTKVDLDIYGPGAEKPVHTLRSEIRFASGNPPHAQAEFGVDPATEGGLPSELLAEDAKQLMEGKWRFVARVPRDKREAYASREHVAAPATVQVVKKPLRVLLVAGGPTHEYQFLRTLLVRETDQKRAELSVFLQNDARDGKDVAQDVPPDRLLNRFPAILRAEDDPGEKPEDIPYNLARYDVIIAHDPNWAEFTAEQLELLKEWVARQAGGLIFVAGPVNTFQLARGEEGGRLKPLLEVLPVVPDDSVLVTNAARLNSRVPWRLKFVGANRQYDFLKLDDNSDDPLAGWKEYFDGFGEPNAPNPQRGFFSAYPVKSVKGTVLATLTDPQARTKDGNEAPFLVTMNYGSGRVVYVASAEFRRLRQFKEVFYERFWMKLARWTSAGGRTRIRRGVLVMGREFAAGDFVRIEAQFFGPTLQPLPRTTRAKLTVAQADGTGKREVEFTPKPSSTEWAGWFQARFPAEKPGDYTVEVPIPGAAEILRGKFAVKAVDPELDQPRPDAAALYQMAGDAKEIDDRLKDVREREALRGRLRGVISAGDQATNGSDAAKLVFVLPTADAIPGCMSAQTKEQRNRGALDDVWDDGPVFGRTESDKPIEISTALMIVVGLLSLEWLGRKLLRLA